MPSKIQNLQKKIPRCRRCSRLNAYRREMKERYPSYWCRPVPGFGDGQAKLVVVGLAPGLHGANQTGIPFQGDAAGDWLYASLGRHGYWDGRRLLGAYIVNAAKCVPPANKPTGEELGNCLPWLIQELDALARVNVVLALGRVAHQAILRCWEVKPLGRVPFSHGAVARLDSRPVLVSSFHPSRQNTNTGRLTPGMWNQVWKKVSKLSLGSP